MKSKTRWVLLEESESIPNGQRVLLKLAGDDGKTSCAIATYDGDADLFKYTLQENKDHTREIAYIAIPE